MNWWGGGFIPIVSYASHTPPFPANGFLLLDSGFFMLLDNSYFLLLGVT